MTTQSRPTSAPAPSAWPLSYIGDDWSFPYAYQNPDGSAMDFTAAEPRAQLFARDQIAPVFVLTGTPSVTIDADPTTGLVVFSVAAALTATLRADGDSEGYPTRIQVMVVDSSGKTKTLRVDPVPVTDARFVALCPAP